MNYDRRRLQWLSSGSPDAGNRHLQAFSNTADFDSPRAYCIESKPSRVTALRARGTPDILGTRRASPSHPPSLEARRIQQRKGYPSRGASTLVHPTTPLPDHSAGGRRNPVQKPRGIFKSVRATYQVTREPDPGGWVPQGPSFLTGPP